MRHSSICMLLISLFVATALASTCKSKKTSTTKKWKTTVTKKTTLAPTNTVVTSKTNTSNPSYTVSTTTTTLSTSQPVSSITSVTSSTSTTSATTTASIPPGYTVWPGRPEYTVPILPFPSTVLSSYAASPTDQYTLAASYQYGCAPASFINNILGSPVFDGNGQNEAAVARRCVDTCAQYAPQNPSFACDTIFLLYQYPYSADGLWECYANAGPVQCTYSGFDIGYGFQYVNSTKYPQ